MNSNFAILLLALFCLGSSLIEATRTVSYDRRAITVDGKRKLLFAGHFHYPRTTVDQWDKIFRMSKEAGVNAIDTYVFWNEHEEVQGQYDFEGNRDIRLFIKKAQEAGLYVVLRIGPYVCAEWNYGGFPSWLREVPGIEFRTDNEPFKREMSRFVSDIVDYTRDLLYTNGGNIILLQIENEYGMIQKDYGSAGDRYANWAANFAQGLNTSSTPWFMCQQNNIPSLVNTCNGFYCDNWLSWRPYKDQPAMFTENWTGWFMAWGDLRPLRPAADLAFGILRWIARGGTYTGHYMWFGGTNFGRTAGVGLTTDYDYDAPIDQYGFKSEPKYSHIGALQNILAQYEDIVTGDFVWSYISAMHEAHVFGDANSENSILFLSNIAANDKVDKVKFWGKRFDLPGWSVSIIKGPKSNPTVLYNSANIKTPMDYWNYKSLAMPRAAYVVDSKKEPIPSFDARIALSRPAEQLSMTHDKTDYLWYVTKVTVDSDKSSVLLEIDGADDHIYIFWNGNLVGAARGGDDLKFNFAVDAGSTGLLQIQTQTLGLTNFGAHREQWTRGLRGKIWVNHHEITEGSWMHQVGLVGESEKYFEGTFTATSDNAKDVPMTWYRIRTPSLPKELDNEDEAFVLDLGSMGKGHAWVNGNGIGRYWNITASLPGSPSQPYPPSVEQVKLQSSTEKLLVRTPENEVGDCHYYGGFNADNCRDPKKVGTPTQRYYTVPRSWINFDGQENVIVLFEETGGDIAGVEFMTVHRSTEPEVTAPKFIVQ